MANYITTDEELTDIADAIRARGGTSETLSYPNGFKSGIAAIPDTTYSLTQSTTDPYSITLEGTNGDSDTITIPTDTSKQAKITASGILKGDGNGSISAATAEIDYGTYSKPSGGIPLSDLASDVQEDLTKNVFIATYGVTTYADISAAFNAGKSIFVKRDLNGESLYALHVKKTDGSFYFRTFSTTVSTLYGCTITSDGSWSVNSYGLATLSSPTLTGTPKAPTAAAGTNTTQIATTAFVKTAIDNSKSSALSLTLASGSWSSATPSTQTIAATGVTASNIIVVGFGSGITSAQYDAASAAKLACTAQGAGTITMTAFGTTPTENIPISVVILG